MHPATPVLGFLSLILLGGDVLLSFFVLLGGAVNSNPVNQFYFLQADTSAIAGAPALTRWTFWNYCAVNANGRNQCGGHAPAYPLDPPRNFGVGSDYKGIPSQFLGTHHYYYMTRFMFAFFLIGLVFSVLALFTGLLALCSRIGSYISSFLTFVALFFQLLATCLMTAAYVQGRNDFRKNGQAAKIGSYNFGFMWAVTVCLFLASVFFCVGGAAAGKAKAAAGGGFARFRGKKGSRNRGSFIDRSSFEKGERPNGV